MALSIHEADLDDAKAFIEGLGKCKVQELFCRHADGLISDLLNTRSLARDSTWGPREEARTCQLAVEASSAYKRQAHMVAQLRKWCK